MATEQFDSNRSHIEILADVQLTKEQTERIKADIGIDVSLIVVQHVARLEARALDPSYVSVVRLTWCW